MIYIKSLLNCIFMIIIPQDQVFTDVIVFTIHFWRIEYNVVNTTGCDVYAAAGHTFDDLSIIDVDLYHRVDFDILRFQRICLWY